MMRPLFMPMDIMHPPWYNARDECGGVQKRIDLHPREMFNAPHMHPLGCVLLKLNIIPKQVTTDDTICVIGGCFYFENIVLQKYWKTVAHTKHRATFGT